MLENIKIKLNRLCKNSSTKKFLVKADEKLLGKSDENFKLVKGIILFINDGKTEHDGK